MQVFLESLKVVPEWLVQQIYLHSWSGVRILRLSVSLKEC